METITTNSIIDFSKIEIDWHQIVAGAINVAIIVAIAILIVSLLSRLLNRLEKKAKLSKQTLLPVRLVARYGVLFAALVLILGTFGIPIGNFWTFISTVLGLVAIGFVAVWSVLSNISSTLLILGFKPFKVGDYVRLVGDEVSGRVIDVNFMFTTLRRTSGDVFRVPNNQFFQKTILRPGDGGASDEEESKEEKTKSSESEKKNDIDHSQQNLEGIRQPKF
ncbi:mechanosensitive ion channel family protein [Pelagicoccus albus]|uniref:Mechanosensitive ion channel n=1 Tax=Pelagicoccus albus TaxID=415222 RepID=A0A7X1B383_9BACT|nr:mechanosensitive ion channel domain-containing protein [Pelagicoccus albus]MBC2604767.1 mechanosensitive ion channel [Pelagicoccus albus]